MKALEVSELSPQELGDDTLVLVYTADDGAGQASLENIKKFLGVIVKSVTEETDENGRKKVTVIMKSGGSEFPFEVSDGVGLIVDDTVVSESSESGGTNTVTVPTTDGKSLVFRSLNGRDAGFSTPTAEATAIEHDQQPTVEVTASGDDQQKVFSFNFGIPKGTPAGFGTPVAAATLLPTGSQPTVEVTASGDDQQKVFSFNFGIPGGMSEEERSKLAELENYDDEELSGRVSANEDAIAVLNGDSEGSVAKKIADALAEIVANAPQDFDTLKEISDWISGHAASAAEMNSAIAKNASDITELQDGLTAARTDMLKKEIVESLPQISEAEENVLYWIPDERMPGVYQQYAVRTDNGEKTFIRLGAGEGGLAEAASFADALDTGLYSVPSDAQDKPPLKDGQQPVSYMCRTISNGAVAYQTAYPSTDDEDYMVYMRRVPLTAGAAAGTWRILMVG